MNDIKLVELSNNRYIVADIVKTVLSTYKDRAMYFKYVNGTYNMLLRRVKDNNDFELILNDIIKSKDIRNLDPKRINFKTFEELIDQHIKLNNVL